MLLHKHSNLFLCSKFKVSSLGNKSQRHLVLLHSGSTLCLKGTTATTWKFSCSFFEFLEDFNYCLSLERLKQKLELLYHTLQESFIKVLVWELVTWTKTNDDFFFRQSKDQWKILFPQIDKTDGPHPPKHNFHSTPLAKESIKNTCPKILNCTHCLHKVKNGSKGWTSTWSSEDHLFACFSTLYNAWQYVKPIGSRQPKFTLR